MAVHLLPKSVLGCTVSLPKGDYKMDYTERLTALDRHISEHPADYQAVIARLKLRSDAIDHQMYMRKVERLKRVAEYRRHRNGNK